MVVIIEIEQDQQDLRLMEVEVDSEETELAAFLQPVAEKLEIPLEELVLDLGVGETQFHPHSKVGECLQHGYRWRHRRVCIDLHFESEEARHHFPARATWARVHHWGCSHFNVPHEACGNLELHEGTPAGPVLNDRTHIGHHQGCVTVWLVKPGPEPYGDEPR
ncbi:MAG: hypothetical protein ACLQVM_19785 [Terriglobia bacterium]